MYLVVLRIKSRGDPEGFNTFLLQHGIRPKEVPRYVGNRWNQIFLMAKTILARQPQLVLYLETKCKKEAQRFVLIIYCIYELYYTLKR